MISSPDIRHNAPRRLTAMDDRPASPRKPRRIFLECTSTFRYDVNTGIQRVVRNLVNSAAAVGQGMSLTCEPLVFDLRSGYRTISGLPRPTVQEGSSTSTADSAVAPRKVRRGWPSFVKRMAKQSLTAIGLLDLAQRVATAYRSVNRRIPLLGEGDVLLLIDAAWTTPDIWGEVKAAKARGARIGAVVYDLIPLQFPQHYGSETVGIFRVYWEQVLEQADFAVCISRAVWRDVQDNLQGQLGRRGGTNLPAGVFRLGTGLEGESTDPPSCGRLERLFGDRSLANPYLMVGGLDPRKNLDLVLKAFERLWAANVDVRLVIVDQKNRSNVYTTFRHIQSHREYQRRLIWLHDVADNELDFCYRRAAALISASYAEGFNLPIVEALSRRLPVLAADIPTHREVAGSYASYFPPHDGVALAELIVRHQHDELHSNANGFYWPDWTESCRDLLEQTADLSHPSD
jgi:alpha-1,2-rhamnosyltransferase